MIKKKIVYIPLDERPCNYDFPYRLFSHDDIEIIRPERLGDKKHPANVQSIQNFIIRESTDAYGLILSVDMLAYGGLIPSRLRSCTSSDADRVEKTLSACRRRNPSLQIFAFQVIMRCPNYSSSDEEPDYYETYGADIHHAGELLHKSNLGLCSEDAAAAACAKVPQKILDDYRDRRKTNRNFNCSVLRYFADGLIDILIIPQDDSAPYGFAAMDQQYVRTAITAAGLSDRVLMYPGADEVGLTLSARMIATIRRGKPSVFVKYASDAARNLVPLYEGNRLEVTVGYHVTAAGCRLSDTVESADILLVITAPSVRMKEAVVQPEEDPSYSVDRNLPALSEFLKDNIASGKVVTVCDNAYANGGDLVILDMLDRNRLLLQLSGYAGWNTSANTLGTAIAEGIDAYFYGKGKTHMEFLFERYVEDCGYCSVVRENVTKRLDTLGMNYFDVKEKYGVVSHMVKEELMSFSTVHLSSIHKDFLISSVGMPWRRMFEIDVSVSCTEQAEKNTAW